LIVELLFLVTLKLHNLVSIKGKAKNKDILDYTGRLMDWWKLYSIVGLKILIPFGLLAHYCLFPMALTYPSSVFKGTDACALTFGCCCCALDSSSSIFWI
jgi:hypothetical protein